MNLQKPTEYLALAALLVTFFAYFSVPVWDIDFWWHIAAGKNILETRSIPTVDPFGVYDANNVWGQTVLKSQWLGQTLLYLVYRWSELDSVIYFRAGMLVLCLALVYVRCRIAAIASLFSLGITTLAGLAILQHTGERPQLFSFVYLSIVFLLFDLYLNGEKRWALFCIPPIMLLWSNTHGGVVFGAAALGVFGAAIVLENRWASGKFNKQKIGLIGIIVGLSILAVMLAPNGVTTFKYLLFLENSPIRDRVSEYASPWSLWPATFYYWVFIGVALTALPGFFNKNHLKHGIVVLVIGLISITSYRYIPLFVLLSAPYVAASLSRLLSAFKLPAVAVNLSVVAISLLFLGYGLQQNKLFQHGLKDARFPVGAVNFIKTHHLGGKIFNAMNWGGYLIWNLPNSTTVFIDGRLLDPDRVMPYTHVLWTTVQGRRFFEQAHFDLVLVPHGNVISGERYPIVDYLLHHPGWEAAYQDNAGYLFVKK